MPRRGLSSMLKELRELENHALDDEEEAMREMEEEEMAEAEAAGPAKKKVHLPVFDEPELPPLPPGAYVDETLVDEDEGVEKGDAPRVWKKKGLKRQHRRVISTSILIQSGVESC